ncbi:MAG: efflux transporter outer membrane subunit [Steroidobacteraceae bacterium]
MTRARHACAALAAVSLAACVSTTEGTPRVSTVDPASLGLDGPAAAQPATDWWTALGDPQLDRLVSAALAGNPGLAAALARVRAAVQQANAAGAGLDPRVDFDLGVYRSKVSSNYIYPPPYAGSTFWDGRVGFNLVWTLDFWGRQAALIEQASSTARASALDADAAALAVSGAVTQTYVDLARTIALEAVATDSVADRERIVELTTRRAQAGLDGDTELESARAQRALAGVALEQARLGRTLATHALATLTGRSAAAPVDLAAPSPDLGRSLALPDVLPADLLAHRPDVAAALARVDAARAGRDAAHAAFYPNINLIGFAGFTAVGLDSLPKGDSQTWTLGPAIHLPVFDSGRLKAEHAKSTAELDAAVATYNDTVLRAIREAADQAARVRQLDAQLAEQSRALAAAEKAEALAGRRYAAGLANYLTVLNAANVANDVRRQRANLLADRTQAGIALVVALGGGWNGHAGAPAASHAANTPLETPK